MMRRRSRRRRSNWAWADNTVISVGVQAANVGWQTYAAFPQTRVQYLAENWKKPTVTVDRIIAFMQLVCKNTSGANAIPPPYVDLYLMKGAEDQSGGTQFYQPFLLPAVPSGTTTWFGSGDTDGLEPFLWTCRVYTRTIAGSQISAIGTLGGNNACDQLEFSAAVPAVPQNNFAAGVFNPFMPTVDIRVKRRLQRQEQLVWGIAVPPQAATAFTYTWSLAYRALAH